jgi:ABC-type branched-subunit amino acid transport system substrate-binding protein
MVTGDFTSTIPFTVPETVPAVKGALQGFPGVQVITCDSKGTAGAAQSCERQAVQENVSAVIIGFKTTQTSEILNKAGIPVLGNAEPTVSNSFTAISSFASYAAMGVGLKKEGCEKLGILYLDGSDFLIDYIKKGFESQGGQEVARSAVPATAPDLTPAVAKITGSGAQCVALSLPPTQVAQAVTAIKQSGKKLQMAGISAVLTKQVLNSLGSLTDGLIIVDSQLNPNDKAPGLDAVKADMKNFDSKAPLTQVGIMTWVSAKVLGAALQKVQGPVTPVSLTAALNGLRNVDTQGVTPPWSSVELPNPAFKRYFNHYGINYKIVDGKPTRSGDFYDLTPVLTAK